VRSLASAEARVLEGTEGSGTPFWSPDGRDLAFPAAGQLKRIDIAGGPPRTLAAVNTNVAGAWSSDGTILIGMVGDGLYRVSAAGGPLTRLTELDRARDEGRHLLPQFLPGGRRFLFIAGATRAGETMLNAGSLDSGQRIPIMPVESNMAFVPYEADGLRGRLIFARGRVLMAQPFDAVKLRVEGEAVPIVDSVSFNNALRAGDDRGFSAAGGALAYRPAINRTGIPVGFDATPGAAGTMRLAPSADAITVIRNWTAGAW
jgi:eukaryotic-like serine/threonine-protein kinase